MRRLRAHCCFTSGGVIIHKGSGMDGAGTVCKTACILVEIDKMKTIFRRTRLIAKTGAKRREHSVALCAHGAGAFRDARTR